MVNLKAKKKIKFFRSKWKEIKQWITYFKTGYKQI